jgi:hypothetical protein
MNKELKQLLQEHPEDANLLIMSACQSLFDCLILNRLGHTLPPPPPPSLTLPISSCKWYNYDTVIEGEHTEQLTNLFYEQICSYLKSLSVNNNMNFVNINPLLVVELTREFDRYLKEQQQESEVQFSGPEQLGDFVEQQLDQFLKDNLVPSILAGIAYDEYYET